ncbi:amidohydrolase [Amycolatopsis acidiphila]|uniref:Amidohydrolase n=1 Tax=Amycolatopsis acidiphila TaxID=715473 RepID=A0A558AF27_9PSEU|nr:amidohydrolase [Amycolatopsis acidiphila]TVT22862.1 amidohydrolase [Amycolatopsis acidiphila]UIJ58126.1 amidohydrolase [Amycolatopsis acidiphila]GHG69909.1 hippurate hydrolase [Amycolatopsis acidiphila]
MTSVLAPLEGLLPSLRELYVDLHRNPELSFAEYRTAAELARRLTEAGYEVRTGIGGTGVAGVLHNGPGPVVMLRADIDALPVEEKTGLDYASRAHGTDEDGKDVPVMHACGHDMHATWLSGAADVLARARESWRGTLLVVFQPGEERGSGAKAMLRDGLFDLAGLPSVVLGQHVVPGPAGWVLTRPGVIMAATDALRIVLHGRGGHGSRPETTIDPAVMAASVVMRLQTIVSREISATESAVVTVGQLHVGTANNIIADDAVLEVNVRSFDEQVREKVLAAVERIVRAEAVAAGAPEPPEITPIASFPVTANDEGTNTRLTSVFREHFGAERVLEAPLVTGSEDFSEFGRAAGVPSVFWLVGGLDPEQVLTAIAAGRFERDVPSNHSSLFAPVLEPTVRAGVETLVTGALAFLSVPSDMVVA